MKLAMLTLACSALLASSAAAQTGRYTYDHVHFGVADPPTAAQWYQKNVGAQPGPAGEPGDRVQFGGIRVIFLKAATPPLPAAGGVIDHVAITAADPAAKIKALEAAGAKVVTPYSATSAFRSGIVEDPYGIRIEVVTGAEPSVIHHVHLKAADAAAALKWFVDFFEGTTGKLGSMNGVRFGEVWLVADQGDSAASAGRAIDHLGFRTTELDAKATELKGRGVRFTGDPAPLRDIRVSYLVGPGEMKIELLQR